MMLATLAILALLVAYLLWSVSVLITRVTGCEQRLCDLEAFLVY